MAMIHKQDGSISFRLNSKSQCTMLARFGASQLFRLQKKTPCISGIW